jgi:hypothetical protein
VRIVVAGRTRFDRTLTHDEIRRLGDLRALHVANDVRFAGPRDLAAGGTALMQYRASPPGYRIVDAIAASQLARDLGRADCARKGSFELERSASHAGTTARIRQRAASFSCVSIRPDESIVEISPAGGTAYSSRLTMTDLEKLSPPQAEGALFVTDGPAFVNLEHTGAPSIILTGSTGDAYCCYRTHIFYPSGARAYREAVHRWGHRDSYPALLRDRAAGGRVLFASSVDDFAWTIGIAKAVAPLQFFAFERGRFRNVTPDVPAVREQADRLWARARGSLRAEKFLAAYPEVIAYLIDMAELRRSPEAWRNVRSACTGDDCAGYEQFLRSVLRSIKDRARRPQSHK